MPMRPKAMDSSDEVTRYPSPPPVQRAWGHIPLRNRHAQRLPALGAPIKTVDDFREYHRVVRLINATGRVKNTPLPDFPRIPDGAASLEWGKVQARDFVDSMVSCRLQTQVPACYIA